MRIVLLGHDQALADSLSQLLREEGHTLQVLHTADEVVFHLQHHGIDMLLLDWPPVPDSGVSTMLQAVRSTSASLPILLLVTRAHEDDINAAINAGVNDYLVKPVRRTDLATRMRVLFRRAYPEQAEAEQFRVESFAFDTHAGRLTKDGAVIEVTQKEFELALLFFHNLGRPLSRAYIVEKIWSREPEIPSRTMDTHVSRVRNKLGLRPENGFRLAPVYSFGYCLERLKK